MSVLFWYGVSTMLVLVIIDQGPTGWLTSVVVAQRRHLVCG
jgi:hypothetical protein